MTEGCQRVSSTLAVRAAFFAPLMQGHYNTTPIQVKRPFLANGDIPVLTMAVVAKSGKGGRTCVCMDGNVENKEVGKKMTKNEMSEDSLSTIYFPAL